MVFWLNEPCFFCNSHEKNVPGTGTTRTGIWHFLYNSGLIAGTPTEEDKNTKGRDTMSKKTCVKRNKNLLATKLVAPGVLFILVSLCFVPLANPCVPQPGIHIVKIGPTYSEAGEEVTFTYLVNNTESQPLSDVTVIDNLCGPVVYSSGDKNHNEKLEKPETWTFTCTYVPEFNFPDQLTNTAAASGTWQGQVATDTASFTLYPFILRKDVLLYWEGENVQYADPDTSFTVQMSKNGGTLDSFALNESEPKYLWLSQGTYEFTELDMPSGYLPAYQTISYTTGEGYPDFSALNIITFDLAITKIGPETCKPNDQITYDYTVSNSGPASVTPQVMDDLCGVPVYTGGDSDADGLIDPNELWTYEATYTVTSEPGTMLTNTVNVTDAEGAAWSHGEWWLGGDRNLEDNHAQWSVQVVPPDDDEHETAYTLSILVIGNGSVLPSPAQTSYGNGTIVGLSASADPGWIFDHWQGDLTASVNPATLTMDSNKTVVAYFTMNDQGDDDEGYTLSIHVVGNGSVTRSPDQATYTVGTMIELSAIADDQWMFDHWGGDLSGNTSTESITMTSNKSVWAYFVKEETEEPEEPLQPVNPSSHRSSSHYANTLPVANAGGPYEALLREEIVFNGSGSYDPDGILIQFHWSFGDGTTGTGKMVDHQYFTSGIHQVTLTVIDNLGGSATNTTFVQILVPNRPPSNPLIAGPLDGVKNTEYSYVFGSVDPDNDDITYLVDWGDGTTYQLGSFSSGASFLLPHRWDSPGTYTITMTASDGYLTASSEKVVTIHDTLMVTNLAIIVLGLLVLLALILVFLASKRKKKHE